MRDEKKCTLLIDLDGVLNEYKGEFNKNEIPSIKDGASEFLKKLSSDFIIKIFTTRNKLQTAKWLIKNKLDTYVFDITNDKDPAFILIDDRALKFDGDFKATMVQIKNFKPHWK